MKNSVIFLKTRFDLYNKEELINHLLNIQGFCSVVTPNVDHVIRINKNEAFRKLYEQADISINDSRIINNLAHLLHIELKDVIPGSDLTKSIIERIANTDTKITVIGSSKETIDVIKKKFNLVNIFHYNPPMGFINEEEEVNKCIKFICNNPARFIFLAVGSPRQEILAEKAKLAEAEGVFLSIGASLLFLSGEEKRAPLIVQKLSLEWLYRLVQSPKRLAKRYLIDGLAIFPLFFKEAMLYKMKIKH